MEVDNLNKWLTLVANDAILGGLVFLAREIQQNTNAIRSAAIQEATNVAGEPPLLFAQNADVMVVAVGEFICEKFILRIARELYAQASA